MNIQDVCHNIESQFLNVVRGQIEVISERGLIGHRCLYKNIIAKLLYYAMYFLYTFVCVCVCVCVC